MKFTRTVKMRVARHETIVLRRIGRRSTTWCAQCGQFVATMSVCDAARLAGISCGAMQLRVDVGDFHVPVPDDPGLVCLQSILFDVLPDIEREQEEEWR